MTGWVYLLRNTKYRCDAGVYVKELRYEIYLHMLTENTLLNIKICSSSESFVHLTRSLF